MSQRTSIDDITLAQLNSNAIIDYEEEGYSPVLVSDVEPPCYSPGCSLPSYAQIQIEQASKDHLRRLCLFFINCDLVVVANQFLNALLVAMSICTQAYFSEFRLTLLIPVAYLGISFIGRLGLLSNSPEWVIIYTGSYFGRWSGDVAVLCYSFMMNTPIYSMKAYSIISSLLMVGIRGFYPDFLPCYSKYSDDGSCPMILRNMADANYSMVIYWIVTVPNKDFPSVCSGSLPCIIRV